MPLSQRERDLLDRAGALLAEVVAGDRARVPLRDPLVAVGEQVGGQPHARLGRVDEVPAGDVLLEDVVLDRAAELLARDALLLGRPARRAAAARWPGALMVIDVQTSSSGMPSNAVRMSSIVSMATPVRPTSPAQRGSSESRPSWVGRSKAMLRPGAAVREQVAVALVGLLGGRVARVLADRPRPLAVHLGVDAAREGVLARLAEVEVAAAGRPGRRSARPRSPSR